MATAATNPLDAIGSGIGNIIGGGLASDAIGEGLGSVSQLVNFGASATAPYNITGVATIPAITDTLVNNPNVGTPRMSTDPVNFENFAKNFNMSEGAKYLLDTQTTQLNNSAASKGGFYSGANLRAQTQIAEGIANTDLLDQYKAMLQGQQQNFGQQEAVFGNLFGQEQLGEKAGASETLLAASAANSVANLSVANASAQKSKGSGIGDLIGGGLKWLAK